MARGTSAFISCGGIGDFLLHADAVRQYFARSAFRPDLLLAPASVCALGERLLPGTAWTPLERYGDERLARIEHAVTLRWFTEVRTADPALAAELVPEPALYRSFDAARRTGPTALHGFFRDELTMRAIVCRSWGFEEDRSFVALASDVPEPACEPARKLVVVSNGADRPWPVRARQTKQLARGAFERCVTALAAAFADYEIVEVGTGAAGPPIAGVRDLRGQTSLDELVSLLARAEAIVCLEGGIAHLAAALRRPALVLAGPTSARNYGHGLHTYLSSGLCVPCAWSTLDWYAACPLEIDAVCMAAIRPQAVVEALRQLV